jgi:hypothetical protein
MLTGESLSQFLWLAENISAFLMAVAVKHRDQVHDLTPVQWILHQMRSRTSPQHHGIPA